jgi:hypothetical protein
MVTKIKRTGARVTILLLFVLASPFIFQSSLPAQQVDQVRVPDAALAPDVTSYHPDCAISSAKDGSIPDSCQDVQQRGGSLAKPPSRHVGPRTTSIHPRPGKTKTASHGGGGTVATLTFFALLSGWCLWGWRRMGSTAPRC